MFAGPPGSPVGGVHRSWSEAGVAYSRSNSCCGVRPPVCCDHSHSAYVAKPSLSQMSCHLVSETESPYHWWASSWASVAMSGAESKLGLVWLSSA